MGLRSRLLGNMAQSLMAIAEKHDLAVVFMNQVTTKMSGRSSHLAPALGESWSHASTNRIFLYWENEQRVAHLHKSPSRKPGTAQYDVTADGIRGPKKRKRDELNDQG